MIRCHLLSAAGWRASLRVLRLGGPVLAAALALGWGHRAAAEATPWVGDAHAAARLISATAATGSAATVEAGFEIRLGSGWHAYWRTPGDAGIPPSIDFAGSTNLAHAEIFWPAPTRYSLQGLETAGYEHHVLLPIALTLARPGGRLVLHAAVDYAACADICVPYAARFDLALPAGPAAPAPEAPLIAAAQARVPKGLAAAGLELLLATVGGTGREARLVVRLRAESDPFHSPDLFVEGLADASPGRPEAALSEAGRVVRLAVPLRGTNAASLVGKPLALTVVDGGEAAQFTAAPQGGSGVGAAAGSAAGAARLLPILAIALLGGLILNVMPCVLPVVSLKLISVAGQAGVDRRRARVGLVMTAFGVFASFAGLAITLIGLKAAGAAIGWGIQFQWPWFVAGMATLTTLFASSLWGWRPIVLPGAVTDAAGSFRPRRPYAEAFATGLFATLLATPCSAPFVGTAIGFALAQGPRQIVLVFAAMALGLAAPFLLAAAAPRLVGLLPRPGRWLGAMRAILGFALAGTAVWLLFVLMALSGLRVALGTGGALAAVLGLLALKSRPGVPALAARLASGAAIVVVAGSVLWPAIAGVEEVRPAAAADRWQRFDPAALHRLVADGKVVFVDVTAAWCLTCKVNEAAVLDRQPVERRLFVAGVVAMRGDWTRPDAALTRYLEGFGRYGIPFDAVYGPGRPEGETLPELLSAGIVLQGLDRAAAAPKAATAAGRAER
jgi:suppressor for copper-sensitivity B